MIQTSNWLSVVVSTHNNASEIDSLVQSVDTTIRQAGMGYELIFVDNLSTDGTRERLSQLSASYPISVVTRQNRSSHALLEALRATQLLFVASIDAQDGLASVEELPAMLRALIMQEADIVTLDDSRSAGFVNRMVHLFSRMLWKIDANTPASAKVLRRDVIERLHSGAAPVVSDLELLVRAQSAGYRLSQYTPSLVGAQYTNDQNGAAPMRQSLAESVALKFKDPHHVPFSQSQLATRGQGFHFRGQEFVHHSDLHQDDTALKQLSLKQKLIIAGAVILSAAVFALDWRLAVTFLVSFITFLYFLDLLFNLRLIFWSMHKNPEIKIENQTIQAAHPEDWPRYTILCPLYKESAVLAQFVNAMSALDYDPAKLQILLLVEEDDIDTQAGIDRMQLPSQFEKVVVPYSMPKTKPKACNYGLARATGEFVVIYDAEDVPDPLQLKKAYLSFRQSPSNVACVQSKLNFYNPHQNILTRAFTAEYSLWFNLLLTGMQHTNTPIPLGGTSNHFRTSLLRELGGWDAFNVTEDADLGVRLVKRGYKTVMVDSTTLEEANSNLKNWFWQRTRWIKGYIQTHFVHTRRLKEFRMAGRRNLNGLLFQVVIGGKVMSMLINPILWLLTVLYFVFRSQVGDGIDAFFPATVLYMGAVSLIFGNFLYLYYYMLGCMRTERYELIRYALLVPLYWIAMSAAAYYALIEIFIKPHHWRKTKHGLHLEELNPAEVSK